MPIPVLVDGLLPHGRHACSLEEVQQVFVDDACFADSKSRKAIWQHWQAALALLTPAVQVHSAWISGSFVTDKKSPRDIDVTFLVNREDRAARGVDDLRVIESFVRRVKDPLTGKVVPAHGLLVDSYVVDWAPHHPDSRFDDGLSPEYSTYAKWRGYWDDWWSRVRVTAKGSPPQNEDAVPARGYLEVRLGDFV